MASEISRREFMLKAGVGALVLPALSCVSINSAGSVSVPGMKVGYASITWGGNDLQAIKDISSLGFKGIQLRANTFREYGERPDALRDLLKTHKLELCMFSSGNANINTGNDKAVIDQHLKNAAFIKKLGGQLLQVTNSSRPKEGAPSTADLKSYGHLLNEIGKRTLDLGVQTVYHNHMHQLGETPEEVEMIMDSCDEKYVNLLLDIAHYQQGGGSPEAAIKQYKSRIQALHLKDVRQMPEAGAKAYKFVELGQGEVNLPNVLAALQEIKFKGWGIIELDAVPDKDKTPLECAKISHAYLKSKGMKI
ncbi:sugar phosphate isomerase/epimerase family protein [Rufibacter tibetensis]|uniref:Xylose isomerase n=1 Tax=Rufibacter tibetensis TaxID=512763 RepID=A0A0P0C563_9BACT|nr:sugar phosphate isomerase/epimerase [Rufibacter tibetensis]ALJ00045.1 xylose isomerase [Rufibacter tibetensis]